MTYADAFDDSPLSVSRGFEIIVRCSLITVEWASSHGSVGGNDNISAIDLLAEVEAVSRATDHPTWRRLC